MGKNKFDLLIVGDGITGLSTGYHLLAKGIKKFAVFGTDGLHPSSTRLSAGFLAGGQADNFTRLSHAFGAPFAKELWAMGLKGFVGLKGFLEETKVPCAVRRRLRLIVSQDELVEARLAVAQLQEAGFAVDLVEDSNHEVFAGLNSRVLAVQDEGETGAVTNPGLLLDALKGKLANHYLQCEVASCEVDAKGVRIRTIEGDEWHGELVIFANHLAIANFLPTLKEALVSFADQWERFVVSSKADGIWSEPGVVFSAYHGYEWGVTVPGGLHFGGGRFLRHLGGIGASQAPVEPKVSGFLQAQLGKTFKWGGKVRKQESFAFLDCRPCDELPLIGPMFGEERILLAAGYSGSGLPMGFQAGRCLADLVISGSSPELPRRLWPERLRSMS